MRKTMKGAADSSAVPVPELWRAIPGYEGALIKTLSIDIETFSSEDLAKSGVYRYAEAPDFRVLLFGYSVNDGLVKVIDLSDGPLPIDLLTALKDPSVEKRAFNASFERVCLSRLLRDLGMLGEGDFLTPKNWRCTMIRCAYLGLPLSLAGAGAVLGLENQKLMEGKDLVRLFCLPAKPSLLNGLGNRNLPDTDPERWKRFVEYNRRDVEVEMRIQQRLRNYPVPDSVWKEYELDQEINDRGIAVDERLVAAALAMDGMSREELTAKLSKRTALANPNSVSQIRQWLANHGSEAETLGKKQVAAMLKDADPEIREVLLLRQQLAKTSVKKYEAMRNTVCRDGRIRGMFQFYGASRSGRWAGRGVQLQNLPQNHIEELSSVRSVVGNASPICHPERSRGIPDSDPVASAYSTLKTLYDSIPDVLSELIRTAFIPSPGKKFIVCDFSAIEARVIAWLAGESWRQEVFASGGDIYCASASAMFHVPVEKHGVNGHLRQKGKIAELALGYGGGVGALRAMGAMEMGVPEAELQPLVDAWRSANQNIVRLWWNVDKAVKTAIRNKTTVPLFNLKFIYRSGMLFIQLPSGRCLSYVKPRLCDNKFGGESVCYMGAGAARKWEQIESYGPKFVENIVQGISRDLLAHAMQNLCHPDRPICHPERSRGISNYLIYHPERSRGIPDYTIVAHVHDEVILEADPSVTVSEVSEIMSRCPPFADGLLLRADGYECEYYRKD